MAIFSTNHNALPAGYRLEDYQIQQVLGDGSFGITYLAIDTQLNTPVAIKEYFPNELAVRQGTIVQAKSQRDTDNFAWGLDRFIEEAKTLAKFRHANIVRVWRIFKANQTAYIVMEYEQGYSLANLIKDGETATEEELLTLLPPLLDGLETVHKTGYLHRDLKPANIYLRESDNRPVLIDFGAARYEVGSRSRSLTAIVTPGYAPFEQYESKGSSQGPWTDIYALGAVLYRLLSGQTPIEATERIGAIMRHQPDPLTAAVEIGRGRYSSSLLEAIDWALQVKEGERPQTVAVWRDKLLARPAEPAVKSLVLLDKSVAPSTRPIKSTSEVGWKPANVISMVTILLLIVGGVAYYSAYLHFSDNTNVDRLVELETKLAEAKQAQVKAETERKTAIEERNSYKQETEKTKREIAKAERRYSQVEMEARNAKAEVEQLAQELAHAKTDAWNAEQARIQAENKAITTTDRVDQLTRELDQAKTTIAAIRQSSQAPVPTSAVAKPDWCSNRLKERVERIICNSSDPELWSLDHQMRRLYHSQPETYQDQKQWLTEVRNKCSDVDCLKQVYRQRLHEMDSE